LRVCDNEKERYILPVRIVEFKINFMSLMQLFFNLRERLQFHVTQTSLVSRSRSVAMNVNITSRSVWALIFRIRKTTRNEIRYKENPRETSNRDKKKKILFYNLQIQILCQSFSDSLKTL